jgi:hypothetical protein
MSLSSDDDTSSICFFEHWVPNFNRDCDRDADDTVFCLESQVIPRRKQDAQENVCATGDHYSPERLLVYRRMEIWIAIPRFAIDIHVLRRECSLGCLPCVRLCHK